MTQDCSNGRGVRRVTSFLAKFFQNTVAKTHQNIAPTRISIMSAVSDEEWEGFRAFLLSNDFNSSNKFSSPVTHRVAAMLREEPEIASFELKARLIREFREFKVMSHHEEVEDQQSMASNSETTRIIAIEFSSSSLRIILDLNRLLQRIVKLGFTTLPEEYQAHYLDQHSAMVKAGEPFHVIRCKLLCYWLNAVVWTPLISKIQGLIPPNRISI